MLEKAADILVLMVKELRKGVNIEKVKGQNDQLQDIEGQADELILESLRELYNGLRWFVRAGCPWRMMPNDLPPWHAVQQQTQRWLRAGCFETMAEDL